MPYNAINAFIEYNSGNEIPRNYVVWSMLYALTAAVKKSVRIDWGYFKFSPEMYICLVGLAGSRKSSAKDIIRDIFTEAFPNYPIGYSRQSPADMIKRMASDECLLSYTDCDGAPVEVRPLALFLNEMSSLLTIDIEGMIGFLTDIYGSPLYDGSTISRGLEKVDNPCLSMLACQTTGWLIRHLKSEEVDSGFARRCIYVVETGRGPRKAFPSPPAGWQKMREQLKNHLIKVGKLAGVFKMEADMLEFYKSWYEGLKFPEDPLMEAWYSSKHVQALKVAMALEMAEENPKLVLTRDNFEFAVALIDSLEPNMRKLTVAAGRNELSGPMQAIIERLTAAGGWMPEKLVMRDCARDMTPDETFQAMRFLEKKTNEIIIWDHTFYNDDGSQAVTKRMVATPRKYKEVMLEALQKQKAAGG